MENQNSKFSVISPAVIIAAGTLAVIAIVVAMFYNYAASTRTEAVHQEIALSAQYQSNQNYLSSYVSGFYEQTGIMKYKSNKMDQILLDYAKARTGGTGAADKQGLINAVSEAVPDLKGLDIADKLMNYVSSQREGYRNIQDKLLDMLRAYDSWRQEGLLRVWVLGNFFPSAQLRATTGDDEVTGQKALEQMRRIVLTESATQAYKTGKMDPLKVDQ